MQKKNYFFKIIIFSFTTTLLVCFANCQRDGYYSATFSSTADLGAATNKLGLAAFQNGFYKFTQDQGCVKCHNALVSPHFASYSLAEAYQAASGFQNGSVQKLIDFNNPSGSKFIDYAGNSHCGDTPCSNPSVRPAVAAYLATWAAAELAAENSDPNPPPTPNISKYVTATLVVPSFVPTISASTPAVLRFALGQFSEPVAGLENAILEIEIQKITPTEYRLNKPKIVGSTKILTFTGLHVYIKSAADTANNIGIEDLSQIENWHDVSSSAAPFTKPATLPAAPFKATPLVMTPIYIAQLSEADLFTVSFDKIE